MSDSSPLGLGVDAVEDGGGRLRDVRHVGWGATVVLIVSAGRAGSAFSSFASSAGGEDAGGGVALVGAEMGAGFWTGEAGGDMSISEESAASSPSSLVTLASSASFMCTSSRSRRPLTLGAKSKAGRIAGERERTGEAGTDISMSDSISSFLLSEAEGAEL